MVITDAFCFCVISLLVFLVSSRRPWISLASWQRQCLWQWRSYTVALTPPLLQEGSMSLWCDSLMDRSSVPLFTSASASWVCCAPRRKLLVFFSVSFNSLNYSSITVLSLCYWSFIDTCVCYSILGGHWDKWRIRQPAYEAGWQWRSFFCGGNWKHGGKMTNIWFPLASSYYHFFFNSLPLHQFGVVCYLLFITP